MGRKVKRVPLDFDWPIKKIWKGFINDRPGAKECGACDGSGYSPDAKRISDQWYGNAPFTPEENGSTPLTIDDPTVHKFAVKNMLQSDLSQRHGFDNGIEVYWEMIRSGTDAAYLAERPWLNILVDIEAERLIGMWNRQWSHHLNADDVAALVNAGRLMDFTGRPRSQEQAEQLKKQAANGGSHYWLKDGNGQTPTPQEVNDWAIATMGHDSVNHYVCVKAKLKRLKIKSKCVPCHGAGEIWESAQQKRYHNAWRETQPPRGDGWQMWETVSEGSPISPVCDSPESLARWLADNKASSFGRHTSTYDEWLAMIKVGWCMSMISDGSGIKSGVAACSAAKEEATA